MMHPFECKLTHELQFLDPPFRSLRISASTLAEVSDTHFLTLSAQALTENSLYNNSSLPFMRIGQSIYSLGVQGFRIRYQMDKASIIKDAIEYIQDLHEQERRIRAEISVLESGRSKKNNDVEFDQDGSFDLKPKRSKRLEQQYGYDSSGSTTRSSPSSSPVDVLELKVSSMREKTMVVSLTCSKRRDTMIKVCEVFESLNAKIISANITAFSGRILKIAFIEAEGEERDILKLRIENAIASLNDPHSPMSP